MKTRFPKAVLIAVMALGMLVGLTPVNSFGAGGIEYVSRSWDGSQVVSETKSCTDYVSFTSATKELRGWYVVSGNVENSNRPFVTAGQTANIILLDGARLYCKDGINVPEGTTLNIYSQAGGSGQLYCDADTNDNAAIGSNDEAGDCGTINIYGGVVTADTYTLGDDAAGIGGGDYGNGGNVSIYGGTVKAIGANDAAGIGGGYNGHGGKTMIYGGKVTATCYNNGAGIGGGEYGNGGRVEIYSGDVTANGGYWAAGIGGGDYGASGDILIYGGKVTATSRDSVDDGGAGIGSGNDREVNNIIITGGEVTATGGGDGAGIGGGDGGNGGNVTITGGKVTATGKDGGAGIGGGQGAGAGTINIRGGEVIAKSESEGAGIGGGYDGTGGTINIENGTITATGGKNASGIGGGYNKAGGKITINDGTITAGGGYCGAGIGGGRGASGGTTIIKGGKVTATGGDYGAGIGGGDYGSSGDITISGGEVIAKAGTEAAGIGGGNGGETSNPGTIRIDGGTVDARCNSYYGAGIGGGDGQTGGKIDIFGGDVTASGGHRAAGIGGGDKASGGTITIGSGKVKAIGGKQSDDNQYLVGEGGAGIGGGYTKDGGTITIGGNANVEAIGADGAAGIGGGEYGRSGTIVIHDGTVKARTGISGAGIGTGMRCTDNDNTVNVTINGGDVTAIGGRPDFQMIDEGNKFYFMYHGAAIGAGGSVNYGYSYSREDYSYFAGTINLNGGVIDASYTDATRQGYSVAVIGGVDLGKTAKITVKGPCTVKVHQNGQYDQGKALLKGKEVVLQDADGYSSCVKNLTKQTEIAAKDKRVEWCRRENTPLELLIESCKHEHASYTDDSDEEHIKDCPHCTAATSVKEAHTYGEPVWTWAEDYKSATAKFTCSVCGHVKTMNATVTSEEMPATDEEAAKTVYTAKVSLGGQEYTDTKTVYQGNPNAKIEVEPQTKTLTYNGQAQELITAGKASGGSMLYAAGDESGATGDFSETLPSGTDAGEYYVWYMVKGDEGYNDLAPKSIKVTIEKADFSKVAFTLDPEKAEYTGDEIQPAVTGILTTGEGDEQIIFTLDPSEHEVSYDKNINVGTAVAKITSKEKNFTSGTQDKNFTINKAKNRVDVSIEGWVETEEPNEPKVTADYGADKASFEYKQDGADDSTYTETVPNEPGNYVVRATIPESENYEVGKATKSFSIVAAVNIAFDSNGGTGEKRKEKVKAGSKYELPPADTFGVPEDKCKFDAWEVTIGDDPSETMDPGDRITVTADTRIKAIWEDHSWRNPAYAWEDDNSQVTAMRICKNDGKHFEFETVETTEESKPATCEEKGVKIYTSDKFENAAFEVQTKTIETEEALGHKYGEWTKLDDAQHQRVCDNDKTHVEKANHSWDAGKVTKKATETQTGVKTFTCTACKATRTETLPKLKPIAPKTSGTPLVRMISSGDTNLLVTWNKIKGADGYSIYFAYCGETSKHVKTIKGNKTLSWTKSGLKKGRCYKAYVKAYVMKNGKRYYVKCSPLVYAYASGESSEYTSAKAVTVKKASATLKVGQAFQIKPSIVKLKENKYLMPTKFAPTFRYMSSNEKVATVSPSGKITAKGKGTCYIYAFAHNGVSRQVKVTVK